MDIVSVDYTTVEYEEESKQRVEDLVTKYANHAQAKATSYDPTSLLYPVTGKARVPPTPVTKQVSVLMRRVFLCILRDRFLLFGGMLEAVLLGLLLGGIFYKAGEDESLAGLKNRLSLMYLIFN